MHIFKYFVHVQAHVRVRVHFNICVCVRVRVNVSCSFSRHVHVHVHVLVRKRQKREFEVKNSSVLQYGTVRVLVYSRIGRSRLENSRIGRSSFLSILGLIVSF